MDVLAPLERFQQSRVLGYVGQHPQLDLRVVGGEQQPVRRSVSHERLSHLTTHLGADGYILQVWVAAGHSPRGRARLVVAGVHPSRRWIHHVRQGVHVGRLELGHLAVLQDLVHHRVQALQPLQGIGVGGVAGLGAFGLWKADLVEQQVAQLLRRVDIHRMADGLVDILLGLEHMLSQVLGHLP